MTRTAIRYFISGFFLIAFVFNCSAQFTDDFSDGDFANNPTWSGDVAKWEVVNGMLHSADSVSTNYKFYMSTPSALATDAQWEWWDSIQFNPSSLNYIDVYLISDNADLSAASFNGYFIRIGNTADEICLYKRTGTVSTKIIDGADDILNTSNNVMKIKVTRDATNTWMLQRDLSGTGLNYFMEGTVVDADFTTSSFFGLSVQQSTLGFAKRHWFDNFYAGAIIADTVAPAILSLFVISDTELDLKFSEFITQSTAENSTNYFVNNGIGNPASAVRDAADSSLAHLTFATALVNGLTNTITISNIQDLAGNTMPATSLNFVYFIQEPAVFKDILINEFMAKLTPNPASLPNKEYIELYNNSLKVFDLSGWQYVNNTTTKILPSYILLSDSYLILCSIADTALFSPYGNVMGITSWTALTDAGATLSIKDDNNNIIDGFTYSDSWSGYTGGKSMELINPNNPCSGSNNWIASNDPSGGTPGKINSVHDTTPDTQQPFLFSVNIISPVQIEIAFSEPMDSLSIANGTYIINNGLSVTAVAVASGNSAVTLDLSPQIDTAVFYTIVVSNVFDCSGNSIGIPDSLQFAIGYLPEAGDVIINEIFADPVPSVGLPNAEFVELFNKTERFIDLSGCTFSGATFPSGAYIAPNGYLILTSTANAPLYSAFGTVAGMGSWTSSFLLNAGKDLIFTCGGTQIDRVFYSDSWYKDNVKIDGGWSLELINPKNPCSSFNNWIASTDLSGGTPGKINSVHDTTPDTQQPFLASVNIISPVQIEIAFSEPMDSSSIANGTYIINNGLSVTAVAVASGNSAVTLDLSPQIDTAVFYTIVVSNVFDCSGNPIGIPDSLQFAIGYPPGEGDVLINEIFADPTPSVGLPDAEYVELFNKTNKFIDLSPCSFSGATFPSGSAILPNGYLILCYGNNKPVLSPYGAVVSMNSWSSTFLINAGKDLIFTYGNIQIDRVFYSETWYKDNVKKNGGWSLERINPEHPCGGYTDNWKASVAPVGGTPGSINSVYSTAPDVIPPLVSGVTVLSQNQIQINFNEGMDEVSLSTAYTIDNGISVTNVQPVSPDFTAVVLTLFPLLDSAKVYSGNIYSIKDCSGNTAFNLQFQFAIGVSPGVYDILINELYPDPDSAISSLPEAEFVELYNKTAKAIDLDSCKFTKAGSSTAAIIRNTVIFPGGYLILCSSTNAGNFATYGRTLGLSSFPELTNAGTDLLLLNKSGALIHEVNYSDTWYGDDEKAKGGWTLEMIDPDNPCGEENNWRASVDDAGGTPGKINSVKTSNPDLLPPYLISAFAQNDTVVKIYFNEITDSQSILNAIFSIDNGIIISSVTVLGSDSALINLGNSLQPNIIYTISVTGTSDCVGNITTNFSAEFALTEQGEAGDIIINEVLFNPRTGGSDFVEIYNNSNKYINLENWKLANLAADTVSGIKTISAFPMVMFPGDYLVLTKDTANISKEYPLGKPENFWQMSSLPSYNNDAGNVILINNLDAETDRFSYAEKMHFALLKDKKGVSLERIDFNRPTKDATNWHSASEAAGWATPGYKNSQYNPSEGDGSTVSVQPEIFSPDNDGYNDVLHINYKFDSPGFTATIQIYDAKGRLMRTLVKSELLGAEGTFSWDGISDSNEKARIGIYLVWLEAFDLSGKVLQFKKSCVLASKLD